MESPGPKFVNNYDFSKVKVKEEKASDNEVPYKIWELDDGPSSKKAKSSDGIPPKKKKKKKKKRDKKKRQEALFDSSIKIKQEPLDPSENVKVEPSNPVKIKQEPSEEVKVPQEPSKPVSVKEELPEVEEIGFADSCDDSRALAIPSKGQGQPQNNIPKICGECSIEFDDREALKTHLSITKHARYRCKVCGVLFSEWKDWFLHKKTIHKAKKKYQPIMEECPKCKKSYPRCFMPKHLVTHLPTRPKDFLCPQCSKPFLTKMGLCGHLKKDHREPLRGLDCVVEGCEVKFADQSLLDHHLELHRRGLMITNKCHICSHWFSSERGLELHLEKMHTEEGYKCTWVLCDQEFPKGEATSFRAHLKWHEDGAIKKLARSGSVKTYSKN